MSPRSTLHRVVALALLPTWVAQPCSAVSAAALPPVPAKPPGAFRVVAYNIRHGQGTDLRVDLDRVAEVIKRLDADLVALQEVDQRVERSGAVDQAQELGRRVGMHARFGKFFDFQGGQYGLALLSKSPFLEIQLHHLPRGAEPRFALAGKVQVGDPAQELVFVGVHLYRTPAQRLAQAQRLTDIYRGETTPVILAGDFNSLPGSPVMKLLEQTWHNAEKRGEALTFPAAKPVREIDFVLYRPAARFEVAAVAVVAEPLASDHRPVLVDLRLLPRGHPHPPEVAPDD